MDKNFADRLIKEILEKKSYLCVGLDPQIKYFPPHLCSYYGRKYFDPFEATAEMIIAFNKAIIDATAESALCFKPQMAFYEKYGHHGVRAFMETVKYAQNAGFIVIEDAKREDGGDTAQAYADGHLGWVDVISPDGYITNTHSPYDVSAITVTPWIDSPNFDSFISVSKAKGKGFFVVTKTSFKPASDLQETLVVDRDEEGKEVHIKAWIKLARKVKKLGEDLIGEKGYSSAGVVMGATYPEEAKVMKEEIPMCFKLIPGFGYQGGGPDDAVVSINDDGFGGIINNSRATNYAWHPKFKTGYECVGTSFAIAAAKAAKAGRDTLNEAVRRSIGMMPWA
ncbi:MAG: orotidine-5'-phosphate decarboxylase [Parcubacteria group bacterium]